MANCVWMWPRQRKLQRLVVRVLSVRCGGMAERSQLMGKQNGWPMAGTLWMMLVMLMVEEFKHRCDMDCLNTDFGFATTLVDGNGD